MVCRWEKAYEKYCGPSRDQSQSVGFPAIKFLDKLHRDFKTEYRQSYESGPPDESLFLNAKLCVMKMPKEDLNGLYPIDHSRTLIFMYLVRLYHEKDRQVMFSKQSSNFDVENLAPILQYGENAIECYVKSLIRHTKYDDYWIVEQHTCGGLFYMLQFHNFAIWIGSHGCTLESTCDINFPDRLQHLWNQSLMSESSMSQEIWKQSLMWAERRVGKTIYLQLAPDMLSTSAMQQLCEFDLSDDVTWNALKSSRAACGPGTVVLEYFVSEENDLQLVYVMTEVCSQRPPFVIKIRYCQFRKHLS